MENKMAITLQYIVLTFDAADIYIYIEEKDIEN